MLHHMRTAVAICVLALLATPNVASAGGRDHQASVLGDDDDDSLMVSETPFVLLPHLAGRTGTSLKLETDPCGELSSVDSTRSNFTRSGWADEFDDLNGDDDDEDPADQERFLIETWLSQQSQFRIINDGVARACGGDDDLLDVDDVAELLASIPADRSQRRRTTAIAWA